jgi:hypothetical protein
MKKYFKLAAQPVINVMNISDLNERQSTANITVVGVTVVIEEMLDFN